MNIPILVTGGAGYIGAHACKALKKAGFLPVTLDNLSLGHRDFVRWGPLVEADIGDASAVEAACRQYGIKGVIHFAAFAAVEESMRAPRKYYDNNVVGTLGLLEGAQNAGVKKVLVSSSCAVYGAPKAQPISETTETKPVNPYGMTKLMMERILADYAAAYGFEWTALRYFNACGADADQEVGENRDVETHLIPRALMSIQGWIKDFKVFGTTFDTPDGTAIRDYIHVSDLADAHVAAMRSLLESGTAGPVNLGTGRGYSVKQVIDEIAKVTGHQIPLVEGERRAGDPAVLIADASLARTRFNIVPSCSDLETIIGSAWRWHQKVHPRVQS